jgi:hypothetical protein
VPPFGIHPLSIYKFFNVIHRVNLGGVTSQLNNFNFGKILGQGDPRVVQVWV